MKREEIKSIFPEATDEQLKAILKINGDDVENAKGKVTELLAEKEKAFNDLSQSLKSLSKVMQAQVKILTLWLSINLRQYKSQHKIKIQAYSVENKKIFIV